MILTSPLKKLSDIVKKLVVEDGNTQIPAIEFTSISQSLRDTLSFLKTSKNFFLISTKQTKIKYFGMKSLLSH